MAKNRRKMPVKWLTSQSLFWLEVMILMTSLVLALKPKKIWIRNYLTTHMVTAISRSKNWTGVKTPPTFSASPQRSSHQAKKRVQFQAGCCIPQTKNTLRTLFDELMQARMSTRKARFLMKITARAHSHTDWARSENLSLNRARNLKKTESLRQGSWADWVD